MKIKKESLSTKFVMLIGAYRSEIYYRNTARKVARFYNIENGGSIEDFESSDLDNSSIPIPRRAQIVKFWKDGKELSASMITDYITAIGVKAVNQIDEDVRSKDVLETKIQTCLFLPEETYERLMKFVSDKQVTKVSVLENAVYYYADSIDNLDSYNSEGLYTRRKMGDNQKQCSARIERAAFDLVRFISDKRGESMGLVYDNSITKYLDAYEQLKN